MIHYLSAQNKLEMIKLKESRVFKIELYLHKSGGKSILQNEDKFDNLKSFF